MSLKEAVSKEGEFICGFHHAYAFTDVFTEDRYLELLLLVQLNDKADEY